MAEHISYLDNAATTRPCEAAITASVAAMRDGFGNPSSLHALGAAAARTLAEARQSVAALLGGESEAVSFMSGGTEANNLAILGAARAKARRGNRIVSTAAEHSSASAALAQLAEAGWEVVLVPPAQDGNIDPEAIISAVNDKTVLVSMIHVNNETGAITPIEQISKRLRLQYPQLLIHSDGVQAFGKLPLKISRSEIDLYSVSAHKICALKGAGALYVRRGVRILPLVHGGGQERGLRSGTEALPAIAALGAACRELDGRVEHNLARAELMMSALRSQLMEISQVCINSPSKHTPYIMNLSVPGWRGETMLHFLESRGVYVSSGSACSKGATSPVLSAMGLDAKVIDGALRVSLIYDTSEEQLALFITALCEGITSVAHV